MKLISKSVLALALSFSAITALAAPPSHLITHNNTDEESNALIAGTIPSPYPTAAHTTRKTAWNLVRFVCYGHTNNGKCSALIKMATNTSNPVEIGYVYMDLATGDIEPKVFSAKGYTFTVNGPGEATIEKE